MHDRTAWQVSRQPARRPPCCHPLVDRLEYLVGRVFTPYDSVLIDGAGGVKLAGSDRSWNGSDGLPGSSIFSADRPKHQRFKRAISSIRWLMSTSRAAKNSSRAAGSSGREAPVTAMCNSSALCTGSIVLNTPYFEV